MQVQCGACVNLEDIIYVNLEEIWSTWVAPNCGTMQSRIVTWNMEDMEMLESFHLLGGDGDVFMVNSE